MKMKIKIASECAKPMLFLWMTRTVNLPCVFICSQWNHTIEKSSHMWLAKPAILQSDYKKKNHMKQVFVCDDKNCQFTNSLCNDKNCQSVKCAHMQKPAMPQSSHKKCSYRKCQVKSEGTQSYSLWSVSKTASK